MKTLLAAFVVTASVIGAFGQTNAVDTQNNLESIRSGNSMFRSFDNRDKTVLGSVNIFPEYLPGGINMTSGKTVTFDHINYDGYNDLLVVRRKQDDEVVTTMMVNNFYVVSLLDTLRFDRCVKSDNLVGFYQRMTTGKHVRLYKRRFRKLEAPSYTGAYSAGKLNPELVSDEQYFIQKGKQSPKEFSNKRTFLRLFPDKEKSLSSYMKEHQINFKNDEDLIALATYLDSLFVSPEMN